MNEPTRRPLTKEMCINAAKHKYRRDLLRYTLSFIGPFFAITVVTVTFCLLGVRWLRLPVLSITLASLIILYVLSFFLRFAYRCLRGLYKIRTGHLTVVTDELTGIAEGELIRGKELALFDLDEWDRCPRSLYFAEHDAYRLHDYFFDIAGYKVVNYSGAGDIFYLVLLDDPGAAPICVFNAKLFKLEE